MYNHLKDSDVDGNTMAWMASQDRENTSSHKDQYKCTSCNELVHEEDFSKEYQICRECYADLAEDHNVPPFNGFNEYIGEDR